MVEGFSTIAFLPAIAVATAVGGLTAGLFATFLAASLARLLFLGPPIFEVPDARIAGSLLFFVLVSAATGNVIVILNEAIERVAGEAKRERTLIESAPNGVVVVGRTGKIVAVNASAEKLFSYSREELLGQGVEMLVPQKSSTAHRHMRENYQRSPETRPMGAGRDLRARRKDGTEFPVEIGLNPIEWGKEPAVLATVTDITERKLHEEKQQTLAMELEHRVGNFFALILAIVRRTLTKGRTVSEAEEILTQRVRSLAKVHAIAAEATFKRISMDRLLAAAIAGFKDQVTYTGVDLPLNASAAQAFAFVVNELIGNALKHGALSTPTGRVSIDKRLEHSDEKDWIVFEWHESGGPPVTAASRKGFGSFIIEEWPKQFNGKASVSFNPKGLVYQLELPLASVTDVEGVANA
ncbi:PAS domain S-box protein [Methylocystis echinoides]|uniref:PAS domain S-box protein n=1 Tax=Methylocystis echinoides TaxID=29468 RepID=UPI003428AEAE